jgi:hypothetical protein
LQLLIESSKIQDVEQAIERLQKIITVFDEFEKSSPDVPDHIYDKAVHEEIEDETNRLDTQARQHP